MNISSKSHMKQHTVMPSQICSPNVYDTESDSDLERTSFFPELSHISLPTVLFALIPASTVIAGSDLLIFHCWDKQKPSAAAYAIFLRGLNSEPNLCNHPNIDGKLKLL